MVLKSINAGLLCLALCAAVAPNAAAQSRWTDKIFVNASGGVQTGSHTLNTDTTFDLYEETAKISTSQNVQGAPFFDVSFGYRTWDNLALAVGYSWASSSNDGSIVATVPDPVYFDRPRTVNTSATGLKHTENVVHIMGVWMMPMSEKTDLGISFGPSVFMLDQQVPGSITFTEPGPTASGLTVTSLKKTTVGFNVGADYTYKLSKMFGVGGLARYTWASAKLDGASDSLTLGGFQIGGGIRIRY